ncbi:Ovarian tumor, otubain [Penicillium italicum]|uniref:Ovarian tumor, otubain n=1 Tax=Penicillium italicum TaxID=40296 RepID=A0A0A2KAA7_PENIT|nr:Ovarian tumor, otubain [Penicillium italicum]
MSLLNNGGRIVPILTASDSHDPTPEVPGLLDAPPTPIPISSISSLPTILPMLQDQQVSKQAKPMHHASLEMASLQERGLYALPTEGDGNCLYYSLSDQLYGDTHHADEIRQLLANHMASNKDYFMQFVVAEGGERRRPKRAAASAYATRSADVSTPSQEGMERRFQEMIATTRKNGEWGSSEHLQAFCQAFKVDLNVYTMDGVSMFQDVNAHPNQPRDVLHVAFHDFKHYSSVRGIEGKHEGLLTKLKPSQPTDEEIKPKVIPDAKSDINIKQITSPEEKAAGYSANDAGLAVDLYPPWDIKSIQEGLGGRYDRETIVNMLQRCRGDIDRAFAALLDEKTEVPFDKKAAPGVPIKPSLQASRSSSPFSTGSKRSAEDSDDSEDPRPARRTRPKKRLVSNLTLGVGISFRDEHDEVVSLNLRMNSDAEDGPATDPPLPGNTAPVQSDMDGKKCRRSRRLSRPRRL